MKDTEPMPVVRPPLAEAAPVVRRFSVATAAAVLAVSFVLAVAAWTHDEFASLRAEVREARAAAETATRAANQAERAARAAEAAAGGLDASTAGTQSPSPGEGDN